MIAVVPFFLPDEKPSDFSVAWPTKPNADEVQLEMVVVFYLGLPAGLPERFAIEAHRLGKALRAWKDGAIVIPLTNVKILVASLSHEEGPSLSFTVRSALMTAQNWTWLRSAMDFLQNECEKQFPGLDFSTNLACPKCLSEGIDENETELFPWDGEDAAKENHTCDRFCVDTTFPSCSEVCCKDTTTTMKSDVDATLICENLVREVHEIREEMSRGICKVQEEMSQGLSRIENKLDSIHSLSKALANEDNLYPNLFYIIPVTTENGNWQNLLEKIGLETKYKIIFVCAKSGKPVPYNGEEGLVFSMPSEYAQKAQLFWKTYGPMIKVSATLVSIAVKASTGLNPSDLIPSSMSNFNANAAAYTSTVNEIIDKSGIEVSLESDLEKAKAVVGPSHRAFGKFLESIQFDKTKLPMKFDSDDQGGCWWILDEQSIQPSSTLKNSTSKKKSFSSSQHSYNKQSAAVVPMTTASSHEVEPGLVVVKESKKCTIS
uniref:Uncharacterized protein n=2 Tax=Aureoumbra lagunensis TaxID=44058 RepID=A0A7S3NIE6_9STRA